ncbi:MAG: Hpt domain-containing protein, partial [Pirellulales bacterium]|nr:Hpt domain-containing protein [Pirellulales bacterium]
VGDSDVRFDARIDDRPLDPEALERAYAAVRRLRQIYVQEWAPAALDDLEQAIDLARASRSDRRTYLAVIYRLAHDLRGQGGTFGLDVLSEIGASLCMYTKDRDDATDSEIDVLAVHLGAARDALRVEGLESRPEEGPAILNSLRDGIRANLH